MLEHVDHIIKINKWVINSDNFSTFLNSCSENKSSYPPKSIDANHPSNAFLLCSFFFILLLPFGVIWPPGSFLFQRLCINLCRFFFGGALSSNRFNCLSYSLFISKELH